MTGGLIRILLAVLLTGSSCSLASDAKIAKAAEALRLAAKQVRGDPTRPIYHFLPPAQWMNDPCGGIYYKGYYHLFYQLNPYGDKWATIHWAHARSKDLVNWEHLPIALAPADNELRCNSGCVTINKEGVPMIFYTHVPNYKGPRDQRAALGDGDMITWKRHPANPILTLDNHGGPRFGDGWSDCFIFEEAGRTFMVIGVDNLGDDVAIPLYEAEDAGYTRWVYRGLLFQAPKGKVRNMEVPMFFKLDGKWVLLFHPNGPISYYVGTFDVETLKFTPERKGTLVHYQREKSKGVYMDRGLNSPHVFFDDKGRCIMYAWISGFKDGRGWNGSLALPRVLTLGPDGRPRQKPPKRLKKLWTKHLGMQSLGLQGDYVVEKARGDALEIAAVFEPGDAETFGIKVRCSADGKNAVTITCNGSNLNVAGTDIPLHFDTAEKLVKLHIFLDKSVMEVFVNDGRESTAKVIYPGRDDLGIILFSHGGLTRVRSLDVWNMASANSY